ncbi:hypothetical protein D9756_011339 [Leucocoprinus leucothites]|uniref:Transaldolase n=1 Tax=Leucocoprinus leucothites TaxID=201217 RepID=A0A8H5CL76_9AGAR|nr:hypothetical protein D9756_011339 [Leucoagaricus leucothites]
MATSLLQQLRSLVVVDVDCMDPDVAKRHTTQEEQFHDMTSNQALVLTETIKPENEGLIKEAIGYVQSKNLDQDPDTFKMDVLDTITVLLGKRVLPYLKGSVHAQTSPSVAYDTEKTIAHAKKLVALFAEHGIPKERVCIKIPSTPESILACQYLQKIGIQTLATTLFSLPQALAASQAGCKYVAPYFNGIIPQHCIVVSMLLNKRDRAPRALSKVNVEGVCQSCDRTSMSQVILSIVAAFREIKSSTLALPASIVTPNEVVALASFQPHHITISGGVLDQLAALPAIREIEPTPCTTDIASFLGKNYLADGGQLLREAITTDVETQRKVTDALAIFDDCERKTKEFLDTVL